MSTDYSEKRDFFRMNMDCTVEYSINGSGDKHQGLMKNLSGDGLLFLVDHEMTPGTEVSISITPENTVTPPLEVVVEVLRCHAAEDEKYEVAGNIIKR